MRPGVASTGRPGNGYDGGRRRLDDYEEEEDEEDDYSAAGGHPQHDGNSDSDGSNSGSGSEDSSQRRRLGLPARPIHRTQTRELLSEDAKRLNHINSEKKRRLNIRDAFQTMTQLVPSLNGSNYSKATILNKANDYIRSLQSRLGLVDASGNLLRDEYVR